MAYIVARQCDAFYTLPARLYQEAARLTSCHLEDSNYLTIFSLNNMIVGKLMQSWMYKSRIAIALILLLFLSATLLNGPSPAFTGDEPRYFMYASSLLRYGRFVMTLPEWQQAYFEASHSTTEGLPVGADNVVLLNSVYLPSLLSPIALVFGLPGLRFVTLLVGAAGLVNLYRLVAAQTRSVAALVATGLAAFSIPLLPYLHLFYMEAFLFTLVVTAWLRLQGKSRTDGSELLTALLLIAIPFCQLRGAVVAAALYGLLLWRLWAAGRRQIAVWLSILGLAGLLLMVTLNILIYGAVTGPVNSARPPVPAEWADVLSMQLFNIHHGLLAYAPVWVLGWAGLMLGAARRTPLAVQAIGLAVIAALTGVGINPGECWPARFWVLSVPMLAVGMAVWLDALDLRNWRGRLLVVAATPLILATVAIAVIYLISPNGLLENRATTVTYQKIFDHLGFVNPGLMLPVEADRQQDQPLALALAAAAVALSALLAMAAARRWSGYPVAAVIAVVAAVDLMRVTVLPPSRYDVLATGDRFMLTFHAPVRDGYIQFGRPWAVWSQPAPGPQFDLELQDQCDPIGPIIADQVVRITCAVPIRAVSLTVAKAVADPFDLRTEVGYGLRVYRSNSILRRVGRILQGDF